jgi:hypothetical protein
LNKTFNLKVYTLYAGNDRKRPVKEVNGDHILIDVSRIDRILAYNSFSSQRATVADANRMNSSNNNNDSDARKSNSGLWIWPSYFNHSCLPNTERIFFGDIMMIFASRKINKGDEITISYGDILDTSFKKYLEHYNIECKCELCTLDRVDCELKNREAIIESILTGNATSLFASTRDPLERALKFEKIVADTYSNRTKYQIKMFYPLIALAVAYQRRGAADKSFQTYSKLYKILITSHMNVLSSLIALRAAVASVSRVYTENWLHLAVETNCIGDEAFFKHRYQKFFSKLIKEKQQ